MIRKRRESTERKEKIYEELRIKQREEVNKTSRGGEEVHTRLQCKCYLLR